jgi:hypothetical protein
MRVGDRCGTDVKGVRCCVCGKLLKIDPRLSSSSDTICIPCLTEKAGEMGVSVEEFARIHAENRAPYSERMRSARVTLANREARAQAARARQERPLPGSTSAVYVRIRYSIKKLRKGFGFD